MVSFRKDALVNGQYYHVYSRSIAKYVVFNDDHEFQRILQLINLCRFQNFNFRFSYFDQLKSTTQIKILQNLKSDSEKIVSIVAFCIMPTHIHLILKQNSANGTSNFMARVLNSYSKFFNTQHNRIGPLWTGKFKNVLISDDEQLLHLTRYIHLNPTSAGLVKKPENWEYSSYKEFVTDLEVDNKLCETEDLFDISEIEYKKFVNDRKNYQRELALIKSTLIDNYPG